MPDLSEWTDLLLDVALSPALWLGVALALTYSVLLYIWRGGGLRQLGRDIVAGLAGLGLGQAASVFLGLDWLRIGQVQLLVGTAGALGALALSRYLWRSDTSQT